MSPMKTWERQFAKASLILALTTGIPALAALVAPAALALDEARRLIDSGRPCMAVGVLESRLTAIAGDSVYLKTLARAYRECIPVVERQGELARGEELRGRLRILDDRPVERQPAMPRVWVAPELLPPPIPACPERAGWTVTETASFCIHSPGPLANDAVRVAERARAAALAEWAEADPAARWRVKGDLFVFTSADAFERGSGVPREACGRSIVAMTSDASRVFRREVLALDGHGCDFAATVAREVTRATLADRFGAYPLPRWAEEGIAALTDPSAEIWRHEVRFASARKEGRAIPVETILTRDAPAGDRLALYRAESVVLVQYLTTWLGRPRFGRFLRDAMADDPVAALRKHYGLSPRELESELEHAR